MRYRIVLQQLIDDVLTDIALGVELLDLLGVGDNHRPVSGPEDTPHLDIPHHTHYRITHPITHPTL